MLSQARHKILLAELNSIRDFSSIMRISAKNASDIPSLRKHDFNRKYNLKFVSYIKQEDAIAANTNLHLAIDEMSFFYYVSQFERICYSIADSGIRQVKENNSNSKIKNVDAFIKDTEHFFPFSTIVHLFNNEEIEFIKELIAVRNYISHGKKDIKLLKIDDENPNARMGLINNLDDIHDKCISLLYKIVVD